MGRHDDAVSLQHIIVYSREAIDILGGRRSSSEIEHDQTTQLALNHQEATEMTDWDTCPAVERTPGKVSGACVFAGARIPLYALYETSPAAPRCTSSSSGSPASMRNRLARCSNTKPGR